jgi:hypothetical protein
MSRTSIIAASFALAACGGGGGGGGGGSSTSSGSSTSIAPVSITSANMQDVSAQGYSATTTLNSQVSGSTSSFVTGVTVDTASAGLLGVTMQELYRALNAQNSANQVVGVTISETDSCTGGGSITVNGNVASTSTLSAGDSLTLTASGCKESGYTLNGVLSITFKSLTGVPGESSSWSGVFTVGYTNFSVSSGTSSDTASATGNITLSIKQTSFGAATFSISGSSLTVNSTHNGSTSALTLSNLNYGASLTSGVYTYNTNYALSGTLGKLGNASFTVKTLTDFKQTAAGFPTQGVLQITAADKSSVTLTAIDNINVKLDLDKNGDGVTDETVNTTWSALQSRL